MFNTKKKKCANKFNTAGKQGKRLGFDKLTLGQDTIPGFQNDRWTRKLIEWYLVY